MLTSFLGIGNFTIIDNNLVTEEDLGVNFFLDESQLGRPRGESLRNMLCELNPDVTGHWAETLGEMSKYDLLIWTAPSSDLLTRKRLEDYCAAVQKPLITINSQGFYAYFHIQLNGDFPIVETHPEETALRDLRVLNPWPELEEWGKGLTKDLEKQNNHKHGHIPWLALMIYYINLWRDQNKAEDGTPIPFRGTFKQKKEIQTLIQAGQRYDNGEGGEENYDQAFANVMKTLRQATLSEKVKEIFDLCDQEGYRNSKDAFWHLARALKKFHEKNGRLPIAGFVPDMKAESEVYVQLQNLYKALARKDIEEVKSFINPAILAKPGTEDEISTFCKNAETLHLIRHSHIPRDSDLEREVYCTWARSGIESEKIEKETVDATNSERSVEIEAGNAMPVVPKPPLEYILLALRSMDTRDLKDMMDIEQDTIIGAIEDLLTEPKAYIQGWHALRVGKSEAMKQVVREVWRGKGGELHNTASLVGGLVSQEIIKILTRQYVPVENLVVWDGIFCRMGTFKA